MENESSPKEISPKRLRYFKLIAIGLGLIVSFFVCEVIARVYYFGMDAFSYTKVNSFIPVGTSGFLKGTDNKNGTLRTEAQY